MPVGARSNTEVGNPVPSFCPEDVWSKSPRTAADDAEAEEVSPGDGIDKMRIVLVHVTSPLPVDRSHDQPSTLSR